MHLITYTKRGETSTVATRKLVTVGTKNAVGNAGSKRRRKRKIKLTARKTRENKKQGTRKNKKIKVDFKTRCLPGRDSSHDRGKI